MKQKRWVVYDLVYEGETIYVGSTGNPGDRPSGHNTTLFRDKMFRIYVEFVEVEEYASEREARIAERRRIAELSPRLNIRDHPGRRRPKENEYREAVTAIIDEMEREFVRRRDEELARLNREVEDWMRANGTL